MTLASISIVNAKGGNGEALGHTIDPIGYQPYVAYQGDLAGSTVIDVFTDLEREGSGGYVANDDASDPITIEFSRDGTNYGDTITVIAGETFRFFNWIIFRKIRLVNTTSEPFRLVVR